MIAQMRYCFRCRWLANDFVRNIKVASRTPPLVKRQCSTLQLKRQLLSMSENLGNGNVAFRPPLPRADVLLHCGDLTRIGYLEEYEKTLSMLESVEADLKLVIAGNHDITLDEQFYARRGQSMHRDNYAQDLPAKAKDMWMGERAKRAGVTYLEEGTHAFTLKNGANLRVCLCFRRPKTSKLTPEGLRITIPARVLRLGVSLLPQ
jgi:hypothetical protein